MRARKASTVLLAGTTALLACQSSPPPAPRTAPQASPMARSFSVERAWSHLEALAAIGPRVAGSEGNRRAREYIVDELLKLGLKLVEQRVTVELADDAGRLELVNVAAFVPGVSEDVFLLAAPYDSRHYRSFEFLGVNDGASGAAVLLEMARVLEAHPLPYTTVLVFLDGEAARAPDEVRVAPPSHFGSRGLAAELKRKQVIPSIRLAFVMNQVCDPDLRVARDTVSHRHYREQLWAAAQRLGHQDAFPRDASFESTGASHAPLKEAGIRRTVAIVDTSFGGDEPPGSYAGTEDDDLEHCSAGSLEAVGVVVLHTLADIAQSLAKIDRLVDEPIAAAKAFGLDTLQAKDKDGAVPRTGDESAAGDAQSEGPPQEVPSPDEGGSPEASPDPPAAAVNPESP